jgi:hypothetical protein
MGDERRAVNSGEVHGNDTAQPRVGVGVLLVDRRGDPQVRAGENARGAVVSV